MKVEVVVLGSPFQIVLMVYRKATSNMNNVKHSELSSCVKVEVVVLGSLFQIVLMISVDAKQHFKKKNAIH